MNRLKQLRLEKGLLQQDVAKIIDVSDRAVGFYENEKRDMSTEILTKLADYTLIIPNLESNTNKIATFFIHYHTLVKFVHI